MKLITKEIKEKMAKYPYRSQEGKAPEDIDVIVKYFNPMGAGTWIATEVSYELDDNIIFYGVAELGSGYEWGEFSLKELENLKLPFGLSIERDLYCGNKLSDLLSREELCNLGFYSNNILIDYNLESDDSSFNYQMLDRFRSDCDYYLGNGNRSKEHLWAKDEQTQIDIMRALYEKVPEPPEWLSKEQIDSYEQRMVLDKQNDADTGKEM